MNNNPLVTILSPCYNVAKFLPTCLDSIIQQTYSNLQIVLIDDGSKDASWSIMQKYAGKDSRIEIYHQDNQGVAETRNRLLDKVKGDYVLFVDSDDWMELDMVEYLLEIIRMYSADMSVCKSVSLKGRVCSSTYREIWSRETAVKEFLKHTRFGGMLWNKLIRTTVICNTRFDSSISYGEDALFCWKILQKIRYVVVSNEELYNHRPNEDSISYQPWTPEKKGSGHFVWQKITEDTKQSWPQYADICSTRYAIEDMWGLYFASLANYPYDAHIKERQLNIRNNMKLLRKSNLLSLNKKLTAFVLAYCFSLGRLLKYVKR